MKKLFFVIVLIILSAYSAFAALPNPNCTLLDLADDKRNIKIFVIRSTNPEVPNVGANCLVHYELYETDGITPIKDAEIVGGGTPPTKTNASGVIEYCTQFGGSWPSTSTETSITITITKTEGEGENAHEVIYEGVFAKTQWFSWLYPRVVEDAFSCMGSGNYVIQYDRYGPEKYECESWANISGSFETAIYDQIGSGTLKPKILADQNLSVNIAASNSFRIAAFEESGRAMGDAQVQATLTSHSRVIYVRSGAPSDTFVSDTGLQPSKAFVVETCSPSWFVNRNVRSQQASIQNPPPPRKALTYAHGNVSSIPGAKTGKQSADWSDYLQASEDYTKNNPEDVSLFADADHSAFQRTTVSGEFQPISSFTTSLNGSASISGGKGIAGTKLGARINGGMATTAEVYNPLLTVNN